MKYFFFVLLAVAVNFCRGEDYGTASGFGTGRGGRGGFGQHGGREHQGMRRGGMRQNRFFSEAQLAVRFPDEYAEVEALRERYEAALAALAAKGGVTLPEAYDAPYRRLRKADPAAFDAALEKMKNSPYEGMSQLFELARRHEITLFGGRPSGSRSAGEFSEISGRERNTPASGGSRTFNRPDLSALRRKYPERMREYDSLRTKDPGRAREMLLKIIEEDRGSVK